jgi:hypothetical protein
MAVLLPPRGPPMGGEGGAISWTRSYCMTKFRGHTHLSYQVIAFFDKGEFGSILGLKEKALREL